MKQMVIFFISFLVIHAAGLSADEGTGTIYGKILLDRDPPASPQIVVDKSIEFCGETLTDAVLMVQNRGIQGAVVSIDSDAAIVSTRETLSPVTLQSRNCQFQPRIQATGIGNYLILRSGDEITHNPHGWWNDQKTIFNITLLNPNKKFKRKLTRAGIYRVECDTHTWMKAYVLVFNHPFYTVTDADGAFRFENVPAGTHTIRVWHEILGEQIQTVVVESGKAHQKEFVLPLVDTRPNKLIPKTVLPWPPNSSHRNP